MTGTPDAVTRFLTGDLIGILLAAAILTWPVCWILLALYRRAVRHSMSARASGVATSHAAASVPELPTSPIVVAAIDAGAASSGTGDAGDLEHSLRTRLWRTARIYALAALAYAAVLAIAMAWVAEPDAPFRPLRLLLLTTLFAWPIVPTMAIVAAALRRQRLVIGMVYALVYVAIAIAGAIASPEFSVWQGVMLWALFNVPTTALLALCLSRRIRAVGPMVLLFLILGFTGTETLLGIVGSSNRLLRAAVTVGDSVGLGAVGTLVAMVIAGFLAFAVIGAALLVWIRRRYEAKRLSDESLTIHTMWWLFVFGHAIGLAFEHPLGPLAGVVAMIAFIAVTRIGFARTAPPGDGCKLLLLRSFSIGPRGERLFDALDKHWRRIGSIQMIAGSDLATRTVEPHEFLEFVTGKLARRFIDGRAALDRRLHEMDIRPDRDGRFRVNDFFCYDDTWRDVLSALVHDANVVLMDLRGFSRRNAGCVFEIGELFRLVPLDRVLFVVDGETDTAFLEQTFGGAAALARRGAAGLNPQVQPRLLTCASLDTRSLHALLRALASAARGIALEGAR